MEPYLLALLSFLGALTLAGIGYLVQGGRARDEKLDTVVASLASIEATLAGIVRRVDALDRWKDAVQERENADLRAEVADLKLHRGRREGDQL